MRRLKTFFLGNLFFILIFLVLPLIFTLPILRSGESLGIQDWDQNLSYLEVSRKSILAYKQFPLWNPYRCGGMASFADPRSNTFSLGMLLALPFGTLMGTKLSIYFYYLIGFIGFYLLARYLKLKKEVALFGALIFVFNGTVSSAFWSGMPDFLLTFYTPFIFLFIIKATKEAKKRNLNILLAATFLAITFYGGYQITLWLMPILAVYILILLFIDKTFEPLVVFIKSLALFVLFSLPKLFASFEFIIEHPREIEDFSGYKIFNFFYFLLSRNQNYHLGLAIYDFNYGVDENSLYIGLVPVALLILGLSVYARKKAVFLITLIVNLWLMLGNEVTFSLWVLTKKLPIFEFARVAQRFRFTLMLFIALFTAWGLQRASNFIPQRWRTVAIYLIAIFVFLDLTTFSSANFLSKTFIIENLLPGENRVFDKEFKSVNSLDISYSYSEKSDLARERRGDGNYLPWSKEFLGVRQNLGIIDCYEPIPVEKETVIGSEDERYRGEIYFLNQGGEATIKYWSPNKVIVALTVLNGSDILVLNQNYDDGWFVETSGKRNKAENFNGLVSWSLEADDIGDVVFVYRYPSLKDLFN